MRHRRTRFGLVGEPPSAWLGLLATLAVVAAGTLLVYPLKSVAPAVSLGVVYIPGVLLISTVWGLRLGLLTALLSAAAFNWFHLPPVGALDVSADHDLVALAVFAIVAVASGALAELARARAAESERRREQADRALVRLEELTRERDRMQAEAIEAGALRRSDELKTSLLRSVSHDLRTPLTSIIAAGAALDSPSATPEERRELSEAVVEQGQRLSRLVENLLDVSRLQTGDAELRREPVELAGLLEAARHSIGARGEAVRLALDAELPALRADPTQLERAFANLLDNAVVHGEGQPVLVRSRLVGPRLVVRRSTAGRGSRRPSASGSSSPSTAQAPRTGGASGGSGLGLAIAKGFIEANGGEIGVESLPGQGSSFVVSFAADRERRERPPARPRLRRRAADPASAEGDSARRRLRGGQAGEPGEEALDLAAVRPPEAAILDLMLPDVDGVELTRRLREWSEMPILVLSAVGEEDRKVEALAAGADDYVTKPFGPRELVARLEAALRRARPEEAEPKIVAEGLEIDLAARSVRRDGEEVHLTPTEFGLLRALARNRGPLMTHRALLVEVWGVEYEDDFQVLRAHVANLRRKIEPDDGPRYVLTDPGVGYRFAA